MVYTERTPGKPPAGSAAAAVRLRPTTPRSFDLAAAVAGVYKQQGPPHSARATTGSPREPSSAARHPPRPPSAGRTTIRQAVAGTAKAPASKTPVAPARCPTRTPSPRGRIHSSRRAPSIQRAVACVKAAIQEQALAEGTPGHPDASLWSVAMPPGGGALPQEEQDDMALDMLLDPGMASGESQTITDSIDLDRHVHDTQCPYPYGICIDNAQPAKPQPGSEPGMTSDRVAEAWLRLARIALLELLGRHRSRQNGLQPAPQTPLEPNEIEPIEVESTAAVQNAAAQVRAAVASGDTDDEDGTELTALREGAAPTWHKANVCLGDMMEQSVTWFEPDSDDDRHSPKQSDHAQAVQEEEEEEMHPAMRAVAMQQKAPGIVSGMPKCLSF